MVRSVKYASTSETEKDLRRYTVFHSPIVFPPTTLGDTHSAIE